MRIKGINWMITGTGKVCYIDRYCRIRTTFNRNKPKSLYTTIKLLQMMNQKAPSSYTKPQSSDIKPLSLYIYIKRNR